MFQWVGGCFSDGGGFIFKWGGGLPHGGASVLVGGGVLKKIIRWGAHAPHYGKPCSVPVSFFYPFCFPVILFSYFFVFHSLDCFPYFCCYYFLICFSLFYYFLKFVVNFSFYFFFLHILSCLYFQKFSIIFLHTLLIFHLQFLVFGLDYLILSESFVLPF